MAVLPKLIVNCSLLTTGKLRLKLHWYCKSGVNTVDWPFGSSPLTSPGHFVQTWPAHQESPHTHTVYWQWSKWLGFFCCCCDAAFKRLSQTFQLLVVLLRSRRGPRRSLRGHSPSSSSSSGGTGWTLCFVTDVRFNRKICLLQHLNVFSILIFFVIFQYLFNIFNVSFCFYL